MQNKTKQIKGQAKQNKKLLMLKTLHRNTVLIKSFTELQLQQYEKLIYIFVFGKGQFLTKQDELIDYIGEIVEGSARSQHQIVKKGDLIGANSLFGSIEKHSNTLISETDGLIIALRIEDVFKNISNSIRIKLIVEFSISLWHNSTKVENYFAIKEILQQKQQKECLKKAPSEWVSFINALDDKQRNKLALYFPYLGAKQKDLVASASFPPYMLIVITGRLIAKQKDLTSLVIQSGQFYNEDGIILNLSPNSNVYCLTSQASFIIIFRETFLNVFSSSTVQKFFLFLYIKHQNSKINIEPVITNHQEWSIFKKYQLLPLQKKNQIKAKTLQGNITSSLSIRQTLFKQQLGQSNLKTRQSVLQKMYTLKTQAIDTQESQIGQITKYKKIVEELNENIKKEQQTIFELKQKLIVSVTKNNMNQVFKQIRKLKKEQSQQKESEWNIQNHGLTLKQALQAQAHARKIQILVAKCAKKWLAKVRQQKNIK